MVTGWRESDLRLAAERDRVRSIENPSAAPARWSWSTPRRWTCSRRAGRRTDGISSSIRSDRRRARISGSSISRADPSAEVFYQTNSEDGAGYFSPDGRWVAYWSQESGRGEAYVTPFPGPGRRWQVSQNSGTWVQWKPDGTELFVQEENGPLKVVPVDGAGQTFTNGEARDVMVLGTSNISGVLFSISPDGQRVLASVAASDEQTGHLDLVAGWATTRGGRMTSRPAIDQNVIEL